MSKLGKKPIVIPENIEIEIDDFQIKIKGKLGEKKINIFPNFEIRKEGNLLKINPKIINKKTKMLWGTLWSLINNSLQGVSQGFTKTLILEGLGYSAELVADREIIFRLGFSHPIKIKIPDDIKVDIKPFKGQYHIVISSNDKQKVGQFASIIRKIKPRDIYKLKGFRYLEEKIKTKPVKKTIGK